MNLQENIHRIKQVMGLNELRNPWFNYVQSKTKEITGQDWPEYVLKDWLYTFTKRSYFPEKGESPEVYKNIVKSFVESFVEGHGKGKWEYRVLDVSIDIFIPTIQDLLKQKMGGLINTDVPKDEERHNIQQSQLDKVGVSPEPIIVLQKKDGIELLEGWHRTTSALKKYGTYKQNAWVYVPDRLV
jgi:hypothetical protein